MRSTAIRLLLLCLTFVSVSALTAAQKRNITEKDLFDFQWVADPQVSPDGSTVAFVKVWVDEKRTGYNTSIWSVSTATGETRQMTSGIHDSSPRWSPDGRNLAFVRVTEKDGRRHPTGIARFTHVWQLEDGVWRLILGLSYEHAPLNE